MSAARVVEVKATKGLKFYHSRFIDYDKQPALFVVTRVTASAIYYRADYGKHEDGSLWLGSPYWSEPNKFASIVLRVAK